MGLFKSGKDSGKELDEMMALGRKMYQTGGMPDDDDESDTAVLSTEELLRDDDYEEEGTFLVDLASGESFPVTKEEFLIGCREDCDLVISQDVRLHTVSRKHCWLITDGDYSYLKDVSMNGTFVGNAGDPDEAFFKLPKDTRVEVKPGQTVIFGDQRFSFRKGQA